jgi:methylmalonyl-CoA mutase cobalamin-binding subunit
MFDGLEKAIKPYIPPVVLFATLSGAAAVTATQAAEHSVQGGIAATAAAAADEVIASSISEMSKDLDAGMYEAAEKANKTMETAQGTSIARHNEVGSNNSTELRDSGAAAIFSAAAVGEVAVLVARGGVGKRKKGH